MSARLGCEMAVDNVTFAIQGKMPLDLFATAIQNFEALLKALTGEIAGSARIAWVLDALEASIDDLHVGYASITSWAESTDTEAVEQVVHGYAQVGKSLAQQTAIPYSPRVTMPARNITGILNGKIKSVRFETPEEESIVRVGLLPEERPSNLISYGAVEGIVQTLPKRRGLKFTLYDTEFDRAVSCYLHDGQEEIMRDVWGKRAVVEGVVSRDPATGRPTAIRRISAVEVAEHVEEGFLVARGALPRSASMLPAEQIMRRLRDA